MRLGRVTPHYFTIIIVLALATGLGGLWWWATADNAPGALRITLLDGREIRLADVNHGPLLINFWATSCAPCVRELPALAALHQELQPKGVEVLAIAMPYDPPARVLDFQQRFAIPYMIALDLKGNAVRAFAPTAIPYSVLIAPGERVLWQKLGELDIPALRSELLLLIEEKR